VSFTRDSIYMLRTAACLLHDASKHT
jgi:hypothetical protein